MTARQWALVRASRVADRTLQRIADVAMTEGSMRTCPRHGEEPWVEHVLSEYGTTTCPVEAVRANVDDGQCSACGAQTPSDADA